MKTTNQNHLQPDGFAVPLSDTTDLGLAMLIVESEDGHYEPISAVSSIREAKEMAKADRMARSENLERGAEPLCPYRYCVWARGVNGRYRRAHEIDAY
jgi:hypothetical protein